MAVSAVDILPAIHIRLEPAPGRGRKAAWPTDNGRGAIPGLKTTGFLSSALRV
jgi:hypothetical protein